MLMCMCIWLMKVEMWPIRRDWETEGRSKGNRRRIETQTHRTPWIESEGRTHKGLIPLPSRSTSHQPSVTFGHSQIQRVASLIDFSFTLFRSHFVRDSHSNSSFRLRKSLLETHPFTFFQRRILWIRYLSYSIFDQNLVLSLIFIASHSLSRLSAKFFKSLWIEKSRDCCQVVFLNLTSYYCATVASLCFSSEDRCLGKRRSERKFENKANEKMSFQIQKCTSFLAINFHF